MSASESQIESLKEKIKELSNSLVASKEEAKNEKAAKEALWLKVDEYEAKLKQCKAALNKAPKKAEKKA